MSAFSPFASTHTSLLYESVLGSQSFGRLSLLRMLCASALLLARALSWGRSSSSCALPLLLLLLPSLYCVYQTPRASFCRRRPTHSLYSTSADLSLPAFSFLPLLVSCFASPRYMAFLTYLPLLFPIDGRCSIFANIPPASPRLEPRMQNVA